VSPPFSADMAKSLPARCPMGNSVGLSGQSFPATSSRMLDIEGGIGSDVAAKEFEKSNREMHFAKLEPLIIPEDDLELADTMDLEPDPLSPHPGDRMVIDSDKPYFMPSISVFSPIGSRRESSISSFSSSFAPSIATSLSSKASTLVDNASILSGKTTSTGYDLYGWEEGHDQKVRLESKIGRGGFNGVHAIFPYPHSQHSKGLLCRVLNQPPMHH
jgi:hypothetical protein